MVASRPGARAYRVELRHGHVVTTQLATRYLGDAACVPLIAAASPALRRGLEVRRRSTRARRSASADDPRARRARVLAQAGQRGDPRPHARRSPAAPSAARVCLLPTASGDPTDQIAAFRSSFGGLRCSLSHVSLFRLETEAVDLADAPARPGPDLRRRRQHAQPARDLARARDRRGADRVLARAASSSPARAPARCAGSSGGSPGRPGRRALAPGLGLVPGRAQRPLPPRRRAPRGRCSTRSPRPGIARLRDRRRRRGCSSAGPRSRDGGQRPRRAPRSGGSSRDGGGRRDARARMPTEPLTSPRPAIDEIPPDVCELRAVRALRSGRL